MFKTYFDAAAGDDGTFLPYGHDGLLYQLPLQQPENNAHLNGSCKNDGKQYLISQ